MKKIHGIIPFLVSPLKKNNKVNIEVLKELVKYLIDSGVHGLTPLGSTGEFAYLTSEQKEIITKTVIKEANNRIPIIIGVGSTSTNEAVKEAIKAEKMNADGIMVVLPTYFPVNKKAIIDYYTKVASSVKCPVVLYNNPRFSKADLTPDIVEELVEIPNIQYLKDASKNTGRLVTIMNMLDKKIEIFSSSAHVPLLILQLGGVGWMAGPACIIPKKCVRLYELALEKEWDKAIYLQKKIWNINRIFNKYSLAACIKYGLEYKGFKVGEPIHPQNKLDSSAKKEIINCIEKIEKIDI